VTSKSILVVVVIDAHFTELVRVARMLQQRGDYRPVVLFTHAYQNLQRDIDLCRRENIACLDTDGNPVDVREAPTDAAPPKAPPERSRDWVAKVLDRLPINLYTSAYAFPIWLAGYRSSLLKARRIVERHHPALIVLAEDNPGYLTSAYILAAHERNVASLIVPYTVATRSEPAEAFFDVAFHQVTGLSNRLVAARFPRWVHEHRQRKLLRLPAGQILAMEALGLAPPEPWTYLSGFADAIAVESDEMAQRYAREGLPRARLVPTGALYDDVLARNRVEALENRRVVLKDAGLADDRPLILCALPPDQFSCVRPGREFPDQRALLEFLVETFESVPAANVVYRLHPRTRPDEVEFLRGRGVTILDRDTAALVPLCDVFVASVSATIRWAIACGKPVINFDMHRYRYHDFDSAGGVITVEDKREFPKVLRELIENQTLYAELAARQAAIQHHWGRLDGHAAARMGQLIDRLVRRDETAGEPTMEVERSS
jgi:hypothetical protein